VTGEALAADLRTAMERLHWGLRDLVAAAAGYGDVGAVSDVELHLLSGCHLTTPQSTVLVATLNDALMSAHDAFRIVCPA
jgi:hypothetical protein